MGKISNIENRNLRKSTKNIMKNHRKAYKLSKKDIKKMKEISFKEHVMLAVVFYVMLTGYVIKIFLF